MGNSIRSLRGRSAVVLFVMVWGACGSDAGVGPGGGSGPIVGLAITGEGLRVDYGLQAPLSASFLHQNGSRSAATDVVWSVDDSEIARLNAAGLVHALAPGKTTVRAASGARTGEAELEVRPLRLVSLSGGFHYNCGLTVDRRLFCWGDNSHGQFGNGTQGLENRPVLAGSGELEFASHSAGLGHSCGLTLDGSAYCAGGNSSGAIGDGIEDRDNHPRFTRVAGDVRFSELAAGDRHTCGLSTDGRVLCWGENFTGEVGDGTRQNRWSPVPIDSNQSFRSVISGRGHHCALNTAGVAYCWGGSWSGQLGDGSSTAPSFPLRSEPSPVMVVGGHRFDRLFSTTSSLMTCALNTSADFYCWGPGSFGDGTVGKQSSPVRMSGVPAFDWLSPLGGHLCGITSSNELHCWGGNRMGQLGLIPAGPVYTATALPTSLRFVQVVGGAEHTCGLATDGITYCWGVNQIGELGFGETFTFSDQPLPVFGQLTD